MACIAATSLSQLSYSKGRQWSACVRTECREHLVIRALRRISSGTRRYMVAGSVVECCSIYRPVCRVTGRQCRIDKPIQTTAGVALEASEQVAIEDTIVPVQRRWRGRLSRL